jgi:bifunctional UDP-N-acetylglucosamine pyrophosphorylase/glucosamine-1-phosphate N-acetyltransferase
VPLIPPHALKTLVACSEQHNGIAVLTTRLNNPTGYGRILRNAHQAIVGCIEEKDASDEQRQIQEVNTGIMAVPTIQLHRWVAQLKNDNAQGEYYLTDLLGLAAHDGVAVVSADIDSDLVQGVNSQEQRAQVERLYQRRLASELMAAGVQLADPERIDIRGLLTAGSEVRIDVGCVFEGQVELGDHVHIGPNVVLKNVRIEAGARIEAMSHLEDCSVGPRATIGPFARIRPGSVLAEGSHVGNFTELKNTRLGPYSKANHLSYLGDAQIGARVNVGAGTITCNYDGAEKHRTVIEDDVFIGSDTQLVAPVVVHEGATLAAGTTLTADAPAHQLTLSRTRQTSVARWKRPKKQSH